MKIVAAADEAFAGIGAMIPQTNMTASDRFLARARDLLANGNLSAVHWTRATVLPRMHTPQTGLSDRSLSLNLCLYGSPEVQVSWIDGSACAPKDSLNLLFIPWPFEVRVKQFKEVRPPDARLPDDFGFFSYEPAVVSNFDKILEICDVAEQNVGRIDGLVMPEMALTDCDYRLLLDEFKKKNKKYFLIAGVLDTSTRPNCPANRVRGCFLGKCLERMKHHPWTIDEAQVLQYGLGGVLSPVRNWREYGDFSGRSVTFVAIRPDFVMNVLICQDLASPDPVANLIRTVGPNLVVGLLMDGPQTKERWAARFATVLAEDPGCSVLAITSLGMSNLSSPRAGGVNRCRVLAIWKDACGSAIEIELPKGADALALSLSMKTRKEYTADGRERTVLCPVLSGKHPIPPAPA